jgi:hypothetical protein
MQNLAPNILVDPKILISLQSEHKRHSPFKRALRTQVTVYFGPHFPPFFWTGKNGTTFCLGCLMDVDWMKVHYNDGGFDAINLRFVKHVSYQPFYSITKERQDKITFQFSDNTSITVSESIGAAFAMDTRRVLNIGDQTKEDPAKK